MFTVQYNKIIIVFKLQKNKDKEKILKARGGAEITIYRETSIRITVDFLSETVKGRREWNEIFKVLKKKPQT